MKSLHEVIIRQDGAAFNSILYGDIIFVSKLLGVDPEGLERMVYDPNYQGWDLNMDYDPGTYIKFHLRKIIT